MAAEQDLRLAWWAQRAGRDGTRDVLLTLAAASSGPDDDWVPRCRLRLIAGRRDHWFAPYSTVARALDDPRVVQGMSRLRASFPPARVESLLARYEVTAGPYVGRVVPLSLVLDDLIGPSVLVPSRPRKSKRQPRVPSRERIATDARPPYAAAPTPMPSPSPLSSALPTTSPAFDLAAIGAHFFAAWLAGMILLDWALPADLAESRAA